MKVKLEAHHLWDTVEFGYDDYHDDRTTLDAICSAVPSEMVPTLATKPSAHEAWEAIKTMCIGDEPMRKTTTQNPRAEYEQIAFRDGESTEDFALRLSNVVQRMATLGDLEPAAKVVAKYLHIARPRYMQIVVSIKTLLDISKLSFEEVTGRLVAATDGEVEPPHTSSSKLLLTQDEWMERYKASESGHGGSRSVAGASAAVNHEVVAAGEPPTGEAAPARDVQAQTIPASAAARQAIGQRLL